MTDKRALALNDIIKQLYVIAETLDDSGEDCECCGVFRRTSWVEYMLRQRVEGVMVTLGNLSRAFENIERNIAHHRRRK